jgi:hypothetical protein
MIKRRPVGRRRIFEFWVHRKVFEYKTIMAQFRILIVVVPLRVTGLPHAEREVYLNHLKVTLPWLYPREEPPMRARARGGAICI